MSSHIKKMKGNSKAPQDMRTRAEEVAGLLKTLAHPGRLRLVCTLVESEFSVGELEEKVDIHQPHLSQHLTWLRKAGLVATRREGKQIFYSLTEEKAAQLVNALYTIFCEED
ncbi:sulfite-sensing transcriptional repressor BigR [Rhizobium sp. Root1220]|uniref:sulfite-sensing transcriptional repressor BigR n=1 Tax=Rhizobium sp. Root1220 TaxID=1736432 RepID=UPI0006F91BF7|nr:sulfite-sensing transcriptional repressor BigR [Rhizobium sp. Root1220]KQV81799.1 ArsR family transcriptional regulator [Rhizobium sp. Root1220]